MHFCTVAYILSMGALTLWRTHARFAFSVVAPKVPRLLVLFYQPSKNIEIIMLNDSVGWWHVGEPPGGLIGGVCGGGKNK